MAKPESYSQHLQRMAHAVSFHPRHRLGLFLDMSLQDQAVVLPMLSKHVRQTLVVGLPDDALLPILERVDPDNATDLMRLLPTGKRQRMLEGLSEGLKDTVSTLLEFDTETATSLMNVDYIQATPQDDIAAVSTRFKLHEQRTGRPPVVLVLEDGKLTGFLPAYQLGFGQPSERIGKYVKEIPAISYSAAKHEVTELFRAHPHNKVAVLGDDKSVMGIIFSDDVLKLLQEQQSASLYNFAGINAEESVLDTAKHKVKFRYKWLIINLATCFLAAFTVGLFEETIAKYVLLAVYMPIVAGMGGNAATQTLAVVVRGLALRQLELRTAYRTLKNELGAGFINGLINGFLVAFIVIIKDHDALLALVLALAMVINLLVAALFGTIVPLIMQKLKKDPATSATIFITTATDVLGFMAFLGLATVILR